MHAIPPPLHANEHRARDSARLAYVSTGLARCRWRHFGATQKRPALPTKTERGPTRKGGNMSIPDRILSWHPTDAEVRELVSAVAVAAAILTVAINACPVAYAIYRIFG